MEASIVKKRINVENHKLEYFINLTRDLVSENDLDKLLGAIIKESILITQSEGGKIYLPDITKKYFYLKHICLPEKNNFEQLDTEFQDISLSSHYQFRDSNVSRITIKSNNVINSNHYLVYPAITGTVLKLNKEQNFSAFQVEQIIEFDKLFSCQTKSVMVMPLCDHKGSTIGLLELYNHSRNIDSDLLTAFTSLSAVLINNANLVSHNNHLIRILDQSNHELENENNRLKQSVDKNTSYEIIGESKVMKDIFLLLDKVVDSNVTVLLRGETGTGKEVFARAIHRNSQRKNKTLISQNCAALPENLLESELFGYHKGAFTGAEQNKPGLFDQANGGTLFLDEIGDMPINLQSKVLRVIQEQEVRPLGSSVSHKVDVRLIAATHCNLEEKIKKGEFRQDLFYRLNIFPITLPRLSERDNDMILLINHFFLRFCKMYQRRIKKIAPSAIDVLTRYHYPGNVRELQNIMERSVLLCNDNGILLREHLPVEVIKHVASDNQVKDSSKHKIRPFPLNSLKSFVQEYEAELIMDHLKANDWNQTLTAQLLKLPRRTLVEKISRLNIDIPK